MKAKQRRKDEMDTYQNHNTEEIYMILIFKLNFPFQENIANISTTFRDLSQSLLLLTVLDI